MLYFWWGCRRNLKLITLGNERVKRLGECTFWTWEWKGLKMAACWRKVVDASSCRLRLVFVLQVCACSCRCSSSTSSWVWPSSRCWPLPPWGSPYLAVPELRHTWPWPRTKWACPWTRGIRRASAKCTAPGSECDCFVSLWILNYDVLPTGNESIESQTS